MSEGTAHGSAPLHSQEALPELQRRQQPPGSVAGAACLPTAAEIQTTATAPTTALSNTSSEAPYINVLLLDAAALCTGNKHWKTGL